MPFGGQTATPALMESVGVAGEDRRVCHVVFPKDDSGNDSGGFFGDKVSMITGLRDVGHMFWRDDSASPLGVAMLSFVMGKMSGGIETEN